MIHKRQVIILLLMKSFLVSANPPPSSDLGSVDNLEAVSFHTVSSTPDSDPDRDLVGISGDSPGTVFEESESGTRSTLDTNDPKEPEPLPYVSLGCWKDREMYSALRNLENEANKATLDGSYSKRLHAVQKCFEVAKFLNLTVFALSDGGRCWGSLDNVPNGSYSRFGKADVCPSNGKGALHVNHVYHIKGSKQADEVLNDSNLPYTNLGCYKDSKWHWLKALKLSEIVDDTVRDPYYSRVDAINKCFKVAEHHGHNIFALQNGGQCYSQFDEVPNGSYAKYSKSNACLADGKGGLNSNQVYQRKGTHTYKVDYSSRPYMSLSCWNDHPWETLKSLRLNEGLHKNLTGEYRHREYAVDKCYEFAKSRGHNVFALQNYGQCYSMLDVVPNGSYAQYGRAHDCPLDGQGGPGVNHVYHIKTAHGVSFDWANLPYSSLGCFSDHSTPELKLLSLNEGLFPALNDDHKFRIDAHTKCYEVAKSRSHNIFALQNDGMCYSSFDIIPGGNYAKMGASSFCPNDGRGGHNVNHVYRITNSHSKVLSLEELSFFSSLPYASLGCWKDYSNANDKLLILQEGTDALLDNKPASRSDAINKCYQVAKKRSHNIFALQTGGKCYSAQDQIRNGRYTKLGRSSGCPSDGRGGVNLNNVYIINN